MSVLSLDRMAIEEAGPSPESLAAAIHDQLNHTSGEVPVAAVAVALDIVEIEEAPLRSLEGALLAPDDRNVGTIILNSASTPGRRRFTLAHELGHFLNLWHRPEDPIAGFACSRGDLTTAWGKPSGSASRHFVQEVEANRFAIELLAPYRLMRPYLRGIPDLAEVVAVAQELGLSREASARRYVELHDRPCALLFSKEGTVRYVETGPGFPFVSCRKGQRLPASPAPVDATGLSAREEADARDWLLRPSRETLVVQTLSQRAGFAITLLAFDETDAGEDESEI
jgi:Zn-dependent peptidase ImmA (M78 family)